MGECEVSDADVQEAIDYLVSNGILKYKSPPLQIRVNEEDFVVTDKEIEDCIYNKSDIIIVNDTTYFNDK